jgi:hypothetical protein
MRLRPIPTCFLGLACAAAWAADYEAPLRFQASKILPAGLVKGPHHTIAEEVVADGFYQEFQIRSEHGELAAEGRTLLGTRLVEVDAVARLAEVSKSEVFAKAAAGAVLNVGKGVASVAKDPKATAQGVGRGLSRFGTNLGRKAKRTADSATHDDKKPEQAASTEQKLTGAAGSAANSVLGINAGARKWAEKLKVDPYSSNPILHQALVDIGKIDAAGGILAKVVVPIPPVASASAKVGGLVWGADPEALRKRNEASVAALGASKDVAARFFRNGNYTVTSQTRFLEALATVKAKGSADYVDAAAEAADEREALFFVESAELLAGLHAKAKVEAILEDSRALVARTGASAIALLPFDVLRWTEPLSNSSREIAERARKELGAQSLEARILGTATAAAKQGLGAAGWQVKEGAADGLMVPPAGAAR